MNEIDQYQLDAGRTAVYPGRGSFPGVVYCALKLNGEAGEVAEKVGKTLRDDAGNLRGEIREALTLELGDVMWYVAMLAQELGVPMSRVLRLNLEKLAARASRGTLQGSGDSR